jgi:thiamine-monophosphate kinase
MRVEKDFIRWLIEQESDRPGDDVVLGVGDDGAILNSESSSGHTVWVTDTIVDQVHFDLRSDSLARIGRKSLAVNLSDIAAMGAIPKSALLTFVLPKSFSTEQAKELFRGISELATEFNVAIVGGDTNRHDGALMVGVALTGSINPNGRTPLGWRMAGAKPGDQIFVTGALGGSLLGKHFDFEPRVNLACYLAENYLIHAATDISDSLTLDLEHLVSASAKAAGGQIGAEVELAKVPVSDAAKQRAQTSGNSALNHALYDGEDFELLLTMNQSESDRALQDKAVAQSLIRIGHVIAEPGLFVVGPDGRDRVQAQGYEH